VIEGNVIALANAVIKHALHRLNARVKNTSRAAQVASTMPIDKDVTGCGVNKK